jgi:hypothetical protein
MTGEAATASPATQSTTDPVGVQPVSRRLRVTALLVLLGLGAALVLTEPWFSYVDDEVTIIAKAAVPVSETLNHFRRGTGQHEHPPLYDVILHSWLVLGGDRPLLVRLPAILFYLMGIWMAARAAHCLAGPPAFAAVIAVMVLWPFGFHYGRLAGWYSFSFLIVASLSYAYFRLVEGPTARRWLSTVALATALVWTNYFGWALAGCLGLDLALRRTLPPKQRLLLVGGAAGVLALAFLPIAGALVARVGGGVGARVSPLSSAAYLAFAHMAMFTSESIAPWFLPLAVPAAAGVLVVSLLVILQPLRESRRVFLCFLGLLASMQLLGILYTKRLLLIAPWLIIPLAVALVTTRRRIWRWLLAVGLAAVFALGWAGALDRRHYGATRFVEPWRQIAVEAAQVVQRGGLVLVENPALLYELTYALRVREGLGRGQRSYLLGYHLRHPSVFLPDDWEHAGRPVRAEVMMAKGVAEPGVMEAMNRADENLRSRCQTLRADRLVPDTGIRLKRRLFPAAHQIPWRVEIYEFRCRVR